MDEKKNTRESKLILHFSGELLKEFHVVEEPHQLQHSSNVHLFHFHSSNITVYVTIKQSTALGGQLFPQNLRESEASYPARDGCPLERKDGVEVV